VTISLENEKKNRLNSEVTFVVILYWTSWKF